MIILIVKHKAASGVGPANGHPSGQVAHIFDTFEQAHGHIKKVEKFPMFDGARVFDGDEDIEDHRLNPGYVLLPEALTAENGAKYLMSGEFKEEITMPCYPCNEDGQEDTCELCGGHGEYTEKVVISWTTIKEIYKKVVEHYTK